jgi:hypothetical protein
MPTQSIDLSAVTDATFNGSTVEKINLNGSEIWTGAPSLVWSNPSNITNIAHASGGSLTGDWNGAFFVGFDGTEFFFGSSILSSKTPVGVNAQWTASDGTVLQKFGTISEDGTVSKQSLISNIRVVPANPQYNIPGFTVFDYFGFIGQSIAHGRVNWYNTTNANRYSSTQALYNAVQSECNSVNADSKATNTGNNTYANRSLMSKGVDANGLIWTPSVGQVYSSFNYTQDIITSYARTNVGTGIVWS